VIYSLFPIKKRCGGKYRKYTEILQRRHPNLKLLVRSVGVIKHEVPIWDSISDAALYAVIGQMLSMSATKSIITRLINKFGSSDKVIDWAVRTQRQQGPLMGVPQRKRRALSEWNSFIKKIRVKESFLKKCSVDEYRSVISGVWGFGKWSADMIGIFYLGRMDIWPDSDGGVMKLSQLILGLDKKTIMRRISGCETITAIYIWEFLNRKLDWGNVIKTQKAPNSA